MEPYTKTRFFKSTRPLTGKDQRKFMKIIPNDEDFKIINLTATGITIEFNTYLYSDASIASLLEDEGFTIMKKKKPGFLRKKIEALTESNKKNFSNKKLECCNLNK